MTKMCSFTECDGVATGHGLCDTHESQLRRKGELKPIATKGGACTFPGCDMPLKGHGLCSAHYAQQRRGVTLHPRREQTGGRPAEHKICTIDGCGAPRKSNGYCGAHYSQWYRGQHVRPITERKPRAPKPPKLNRPKVCTFEGCTGKHSAKGLCKAHWMQQRTGRPLFPIGQRPKRAGATPRPKLTPKPTKVSNLPAGWDRPLPKPRAYSGSDKSAPKDIGPTRKLTPEEVRAMGRILDITGQPEWMAEMLGLVA